MLVIPCQAVPNQALQCQLAGQACTINIQQTWYGLFMGLLVTGVPIIESVICQNGNRIVRSLYLGFDGDFVWLDTQGDDDPVFTGIGARYQLLYLSTADLGGEG